MTNIVTVYGLRTPDGRRTSKALLALALEETHGLTHLPTLERQPSGKPWFPAYPDLHMNLSHSGAFVFCALGPIPVGVDVEEIRPRSPRLPGHVLSAREFQWFQARGAHWADFYTLWTLKESLCKCTGQGLNRPARTLAVPLLEPGEAGVFGGYRFQSYGGPDWRAAACTLACGIIAPILRTPCGPPVSASVSAL